MQLDIPDKKEATRGHNAVENANVAIKIAYLVAWRDIICSFQCSEVPVRLKDAHPSAYIPTITKADDCDLSNVLSVFVGIQQATPLIQRSWPPDS